MESNPYTLVEEWAKINAELEKAWEPYKKLVARRDEIEKSVPWLKGHGASPFPTKPPPPPPGSSSSSPPPSKPGTKIEPARTPGKSTRSEKEVKQKVEKLKSQPKSGSSPSTTPMSEDTTQNFAGNNN
jgi:hypothetical protein